MRDHFLLSVTFNEVSGEASFQMFYKSVLCLSLCTAAGRISYLLGQKDLSKMAYMALFLSIQCYYLTYLVVGMRVE